MSGTAGVPNSFQNAVTATGLQLDNNFSANVSYLNDPTNRNNFATDGVATNTVNITFSPPVVGGYTAGLELTWKWGQTNTGGVVLNANGLGNIALVNPDGTALAPGQGIVGSIGKAVYDGTRAVFIGPPASPATQAAMETATASASFVTPAGLKYHPGAAKVACMFVGGTTGTFTPSFAYNVTSVVRKGTGTYSINFTTPFSAANYAVAGMAQLSNGGGGAAQMLTEIGRGATDYTTASLTVNTTFNTGGTVTPIDPSVVSVILFGDFP